MRIDPLGITERGKGKGGKRVGNTGMFAASLNTSESELERLMVTGEESIEGGDIFKIAEDITKLGDTLGREPTPENFTKYKRQITRFVHMLSDNFEIKDTSSRSGFRKINLYKSVEIIDQNLARLAEIVLSHETNRLEAMKLIEGIKGLIVNLLL
ncbi:MAG: hypothetical protein A2Y33_06190 [Spirochaetes bacterium GWF1_51_8]|nr:MAG: hypothetical protein A2Y33_06190 [Spirochaetes bacterium GWF1_51_8]